MKIFDQNGMMIIPSPIKQDLRRSERAISVKQCFCPNGHNLINKRAFFSGEAGILLKVKARDSEGSVALSPIFGDHTRVAIDIDLDEGAIVDLFCPQCNAPLPSFSECHCGGEMKTMFLTEELSYTDCIGVCNKLGCFNSTLKAQNEMLTYAILEKL